MKLIHLSDLHIGKRVNEFSMLADQEYILTQILGIIDREAADAVIIAGDIYDKTVPPAEAVQLFDEFLYKLCARNVRVFLISGNHDSPERIAFGSRLMSGSGVYVSPVYSGEVSPVIMNDEHGEIAFYMLPFIKPIHVRKYFPDEVIESYTDALRIAISNMKINPSRRNVLITHQFVTGASRSDSEEISVGGSDNVDASVFDDFDYVALGHIHGPQSIGRDTVRYCGTPLKYSFSEVNHKKSVACVELSEKDSITVSEIPLIPKCDLREQRGAFRELISAGRTEDYMHITLTDEDDIPDAMNKLRVVYPNLMKLDYDNARTRHMASLRSASEIKNRDPIELFAEFYEKQNGQAMSDEQKSFVAGIFEKIREDAR